jgi:threonine synthase
MARMTADPPPAVAALPSALVCAGCGHRMPDTGRLALACPEAVSGDDVDHLLRRELDAVRLAWPDGGEPNPFVRYRTLLHGYHLARARGLGDAEIVATIEQLDAAVARVEGHGFRATPLTGSAGLAAALGFHAPGSVLVKDETGNVSGSHKARHLFGTLLELELAGGADRARPLAIASCGNAALAAAVVARAAGRPLHVFIPVGADPVVVDRLASLGARLEVCERRPGMAGDPTYHRLLEALAAGALAFTCQGNLNGLAIEGGETLGYELADDLRAADRRVDHLVIQVGGGALASSVAQALREAHAMGAISALPRIHTVQTRGAFPLERAYRGVAGLLTERLALPDDAPHTLRAAATTPAGRDALTWAAHHRSQFMRPWETEPHSIAAGILDDETYDWLAVVTAMLESGGEPVVVDEATLIEANHLAVESTHIDVDPTGSSGLAGLMTLARAGRIGPRETAAVLFTGIRRSSSVKH